MELGMSSNNSFARVPQSPKAGVSLANISKGPKRAREATVSQGTLQ